MLSSSDLISASCACCSLSVSALFACCSLCASALSDLVIKIFYRNSNNFTKIIIEHELH